MAPKILEMIDLIAAIDSVKFSSKSELSSRFFGRLKFSARFEYLSLLLSLRGGGDIDFSGAAAAAKIAARPSRATYSNSTENFKRPKNRQDSSDLDENLTESIAAPKTFI